jgi:hypothetical protein
VRSVERRSASLSDFDARDVSVEVQRVDGESDVTMTERIGGHETFVAAAGTVADESAAGVAATFREVVVRYSDVRGIARYESRLHWIAANGADWSYVPERSELRIE